jgi:anhydro-N-acetylmuramic acid kinase
MIVAGVMSGTSADGIDVALCRISPSRTQRSTTVVPRIQFLGAAHFAYPKSVRAAVLVAMNANSTSVAYLSRLNWRLGALYTDAVEATAARFQLRPALVGLHGQTLYHQGTAAPYLGAPVRATWQTGEAAVLAERLRCSVVSDFRPADLAAGGQGAPLVPMLDYCLFRSEKKNRILLNLGGIANVTVLPAACTPEQVLAFDTGPANMVIDALMQQLFQKKFDRNGATARRGRVLPEVLATLLREPYFSAPPPKSCGREQFGSVFAARLLTLSRASSVSDADCIATATALTAASILDACQRFCLPQFAAAKLTELYVAGGGTHNTTLMAMLRDGLTPLGISLHTTDVLGVPSEAKEAVAFAFLAWLTWHHLPGNLPSATGASHPTILGKVTYV